MNIFSSIFGVPSSADIKNFLDEDAILLDVRTPAEFESGCIPGSVNIPVNRLELELSKLDPSKPIIVYCASGMRSSNAERILKSAGFGKVLNAKTATNVSKAL